MTPQRTDTSKKAMQELWSTICGIVANGYGFNRAHSTSYAVLSFQTAYMKHYFPKEFCAAYLTQNIGNKENTNEAINKVKSLGIKLLAPDINLSSDKYIPREDGIMLPLNSVKGVGGSVLFEINRLKPINGLQDFLDRRIKKFIKKTSIEALIKAGVFDGEPLSRYEMLCSFDPNKNYKEEKDFVYEKEAFGFYINETPFDNRGVKPWSDYADGSEVTTVLEIVEINTRYDCFLLGTL